LLCCINLNKKGTPEVLNYNASSRKGWRLLEKLEVVGRLEKLEVVGKVGRVGEAGYSWRLWK
jgi:hypothetical protein